MKLSTLYTAPLFALCCGAAPLASATASYTFTILNTLGGSGSSASAINNAGQIVGEVRDANFELRSALWNGAAVANLGTPYSSANAINNAGQVAGRLDGRATRWNGAVATDLGTLGGSYSTGKAINNAGQVVGDSWTAASSTIHATLWNGTAATDLGTLGGRNSSATAINDAGQVAGQSSLADNASYHATLWDGGVATDLGTLGGTNSAATAINNAGDIVGWSHAHGQGYTRATLWSHMFANDLGTVGGGDYSAANAINNVGQIVGYGNTEADVYYRHAVLWNGTVGTDLNMLLDAGARDAGWVLSEATGINDRGSIVGNARNTITLEVYGFLLSVSPVPEPATYGMLLAGLGLVGVARRRRKA